MAILTLVLTKYVFAPVFRKYIERRFAKFDHLSNITLMILVLCAFNSIASYAGTSILFGAFLAGAFLTHIPSKHSKEPFVVMSREEGERRKDKSPTFVHTFEYYSQLAVFFILQHLNNRTMGQDLVPDNVILSAILPQSKPVSVTILTKTSDTCTFRVQFDTQPCKDWSMDLVVHMEVFDDVPVLEVVTAIGRAANHQSPGLVPETYKCDNAMTADGRDVEYTVTRFLTATVTLESVWPSKQRTKTFLWVTKTYFWIGTCSLSENTVH
ncbi:hypothetical protein BU25DRAFT_458420 [Macroventuria anomochaeta]|uniref:Uncharacterized protein n=1 Tax=Macroventuria anomochaeta TaxID=301207 RepID=A0ACB6S1I6_9PLEO|nr:uncharacterized protein BU25DRAFT_458420 [Macroventuria anomochaeta]KAF2627520.1 hypothetical protein BU25DRAFT_458420 [Macroventuria anomochaeta]